jgi:hypothetical protein
LGNLRIKLRQLFFVFRCDHSHQRRDVAASFRIHTFFVDIIEEREELIELALCDGVEFVVVATRAADRQSKHYGAHRLHAINDIFDVPFLLD